MERKNEYRLVACGDGYWWGSDDLRYRLREVIEEARHKEKKVEAVYSVTFWLCFFLLICAIAAAYAAGYQAE